MNSFRFARRLAIALFVSLGACAPVLVQEHVRAPSPAPSIRRAQMEARAKAEPESAAALRDLAWADYLDGNTGPARAGFARAVAIDPKDARALFGLATLAEVEGRFGAARELHTRVLEGAKEMTPGAIADPYRPAVELASTSALERLALEAPGWEAIERRLTAIDPARLDPDAASRLLAARAIFARRAGDEAGALRFEAGRGCPAAVVTAGPYGHLPRLDLARAFEPDHAEPVAGADEDRLIDTVPVRGCTFAIATPQGRPGVAYAITWVKLERAATALVGVASEQPWHLVVDGETVFRLAPVDRFPARARVVEVPLRAGWHRVALKVAAPGNRVSAGLRVFAPVPFELAAKPPAGVEPGRAPRERDVRVHRAAPTPDDAGPEPRLADFLDGLAAAREGDLDAGERAVAALREGAPKFVPGVLLVAELHAGDPSRPQRLARDRARRELTRALALDPGCVPARYELAQLDVQEDHPDKALARLAEAPLPSPVAAPAAGENSPAVRPVSLESGATTTTPADAQRVAGREPAATAPPSPWRLAFARFLALRARGWTVEAEQAVAEARRLNPAACPPLEGELRVALDRRDPARARRAARELLACRPEAEDLAYVLREAGDVKGAAAEYRRLLALDPTREHVRAALADALLALGDTAAAVETCRELVRRDPRVAAWRQKLADALLLQGDEPGARRVLLEGLARSPEADELHRALAALGEPSPIDAFRVDGRKVIADFEASGAKYDAPAVIVLDRTVSRVFSTGARLTLTHNIIRVQTKDGIDKWGEVQVPEGADVLLLRTVKADGTTREPEQIAEKQTTSVPDLQPGDYVEFEYVDPSGPPQAFPGGFFAERFFFQSFDAPLDRTEYVLATPRGLDVQLDTRGPAPPMQLERRGELDVRTWSDRRKSQLLPEPQQSPFIEYTPSVRAAAGVSWARWRDFLADQGYGTLRANTELRDLAASLKTAPAVDAWVRKNIKQGGSLDEPATAVLARLEGSRVVLARALLAALDIKSEVWLARARTDAQLDGSPLPDLEGFDEALLAVDEGKAGVKVLDPRFRHAPRGFVSPMLRGQPALPLGLPRAAAGERDEPRFQRVPGTADYTAPNAVPDDARKLRFTAALDEGGGADITVEETLRGWPALEWREALDRINEDRIRAEFEQRTLGFYFPGASLQDLDFGPRDDDAAPFVVRYRFHAPRFARAEGRELIVPVPFPALLGKRYVGVAERRTAMQLLYAAPTELEAEIRFPAGGKPAPEAPITLHSEWIDFEQKAAVEGDVLRVRGRFTMPPVRAAAADYAKFRAVAEKVDQAESRAATIHLP